nr:hypothetical protein [Terrimonas sp.]
ANVTGTVALANGGTGATTAAAALTNLGAQAAANLSTDISTDATSTTKYPAVKSIKDYVDASVTSGAPNATTSATGKIQLAGDLAGSGSLATAPVISDNAIISAKIADGTILNADISATAAIADSKLATISTSGKVSNSATTATSANTASTIVERDLNGNFNAGTITASLTGLASLATNLNGGTVGAIPYQTAANTTGLLSGNTTATKKFLTQTGTGTAAAAPVWTDIAIADITGTFTDLPSGSTSYINNTTTQQTASFNISGSGTMATNLSVGGTAIITGATTLSALTASKPVFTDANKQLTSAGTLAVENGGTGASTAAAALTNLGAQATANVSTSMSTDASSTTKYPSVSLIKTYVDAKYRDVNDEFSSTVSQTSFTLTQTPLTTSKVRMFINGIRISNTAYAISGTTVTYYPANNGAYDLGISDRIQFDYQY